MYGTYPENILNILSILEIKKHLTNATVSDLESQRVLDTALRIIEEKNPRTAISDPTANSLAIVLLYIADSEFARKLFYNIEKDVKSILPELSRNVLIRLGSTYIPTIPIEELVLKERLSAKLILFYDVAIRLIDFLKIRNRRIRLTETYLTHGYILLTAE
ncbi:MAG: hypothetical protein GXO23_04910, partial [Crenarchaeota archaeon]|nr:hypothetical protein [Thermoproteota archaeon]